MAIELKDITLKWMYISIQELKESGFWSKDFDDNSQTYSDEWINKAINLSSVKINDWTGGYIGYADNIDNLTEEQQIGIKWATAIYTLHWLSKGTEYLLQATTFSQGSQSYNIDVPQDMQFVPDEVQKILINAGLYENIRFANLKDNKDKSWFANGDRFEYDYGSIWASYDWVRNNYIANNITSSDNSILINFINRLDGIPQKLDLKINPNIKVKIDKISIVYNTNNELSVPFDNDTIYNKNGVWKAKQSGEIPLDVIKDSDLDKNYIDKENNKYIVKTSQDINTKQDKLVSGTNIKTINGNSLLGNGDITISGGSDWEFVDTSDFTPNSSSTYQIKNFDTSKFEYKIWCQFSILPCMFVETFKDFDIGCGIVVSSSKGILGWRIDTNGLISTYDNINIGNLKIKRKLVG